MFIGVETAMWGLWSVSAYAGICRVSFSSFIFWRSILSRHCSLSLAFSLLLFLLLYSSSLLSHSLLFFFFSLHTISFTYETRTNSRATRSCSSALHRSNFTLSHARTFAVSLVTLIKTGSWQVRWCIARKTCCHPTISTSRCWYLVLLELFRWVLIC
jgi:hypothetical protein